MAKASSQTFSAADCQVRGAVLILTTAIAAAFLATVATATDYKIVVENRLSTDMNIYCEGDMMDSILGPGDTEERAYSGPGNPAVACKWWSAGNIMDGVVVWDERWPEAPSCRKDGGDGQCRIVFEGSRREVVLVTRKGRRVLGDLAIKECSKNLWGYGGWVPFGLGCTYPKHDHEYYGTIAWTTL
ncbi:hypothetical protein EJB05_49739, partial [Eragrostis curvula]